jgi:subtilisin family serine protease
MATPEVAGLVALIKSVKPGLPAAKLVKLVKQTASGCGAYGNGLGWGIIRTDRAVAAAAQKDINPPSSRVRSAKVAHIPGRGRVVVLRLKRVVSGSSTPCTKEIPVSALKAVNVFASANGGRYRRIAKPRGKSSGQAGADSTRSREREGGDAPSRRRSA